MFISHSKNNLEYIHFDFLIGGSSKIKNYFMLIKLRNKDSSFP